MNSFFGLLARPVGRKRTPREEAAATFALCLFPAADLTILLFTNRYDEQTPSLGLPVVFAILTFALCRALLLRLGYSILLTVGCALCSFAASIAAVFLGISLSVGL